MALPQTRNDFANYVLRSLGAPVVEVNVSTEQVNDVIDRALEFWFLYSAEGMLDTWLKHEIVPATIVLSTSNVASGAIIRGNTSGVTAPVQSVSTGIITLATHTPAQGAFQIGETVTVNTTTGTETAVVLAYSPGDAQNGYITCDPAIYGIEKVYSMNSLYTTNTADLFSVQYQLLIQTLRDISRVDISYYKQVMMQIDMLDHELNTQPDYRFNRFTNQLYLDVDWSLYPAGYVLIAHAMTPTDPSLYGQVFKDPLLYRLTRAMMKAQWGTNLSKFSGIQLPGGVTLDGRSMYQEAIQEQKDVETEIISKLAPLGFFTG